MESNAVLNPSENAFSWRLKQSLELKSAVQRRHPSVSVCVCYGNNVFGVRRNTFSKNWHIFAFLSLNNPMNISRLSIIQQQPWHPSSVLHGLHLPFLLHMLSPVGSRM